jgi:hypothetical protein
LRMSPATIKRKKAPKEEKKVQQTAGGRAEKRRTEGVRGSGDCRTTQQREEGKQMKVEEGSSINYFFGR